MSARVSDIAILIPLLSLLGTIKKARPELIDLVRRGAPPSEFIIVGDPIADAPPPKFFDRFKIPHIEDIGQPPTACFFTLSKVNPEKWYPQHHSHSTPSLSLTLSSRCVKVDV